MFNTELNENIQLFTTIVDENIHRSGISALMNYLSKETDFFIAPASTHYHGAYEGGLLEHSLEVYYQMLKISHLYNFDLKANAESITLVSLFHDVCKVNTYTKSCKNVKNPDNGKWESVPCYIFDTSRNTFGAHGAESMYIINRFVNLTEREAMAIYHHMGAWNVSKGDNLAVAYETNRLAWFLHVADEAAAYIAKI